MGLILMLARSTVTLAPSPCAAQHYPMVEISHRSVVAAVKERVSCDLAGEAAILHLGSGTYYGLDPIGAPIWALVQQPTRVDRIRDRLLAEYDVEPRRLEQDPWALLRDLAAEGLVEVRDDPAA